jgi:hypothetical protein
MKKLIAIAIVAASLGTPAFAQSFDPDNGGGNIVGFAPARVYPRIVARHHQGVDAYASVGHRARSAPVIPDYDNTGGGSPGYNKMLLTW